MQAAPDPGAGLFVEVVDESMDIDPRPGVLQGSSVELPMARAPPRKIIEVDHGRDMWWSLPDGLSADIIAQDEQGLDVTFIWDWGENGRTGSWQPEGQPTSISRYHLNFTTMVQTNIDNGRKRDFRVVTVRD